MINYMQEFRLHGRGGQGIVVAAAIFAEAVFLEGYYARAFSLFGAERRGAPVTAFIRISKDRLMPRCRIYNPDCVVILDSTLKGSSLTEGLKEQGMLLVNAGSGWEGSLAGAAVADNKFKIFTIDAVDIAWKHKLAIGSFPMVNTTMLGAMAKISRLSSLDNLNTSIKKRVTTSIDDNIRAAAEGYENVREVSNIAT